MSRSKYDMTPNGIEYDWGLDGPGGAWFELRPVRGKHTRAALDEAADYLFRSRDVMRFYVSWQEVEECIS
jgi:hypothetical protein